MYNNVDLKPCPFCGSEVWAETIDGPLDVGPRYFGIECPKCCFLLEMDSYDDLFERWNMRVESQPPDKRRGIDDT